MVVSSVSIEIMEISTVLLLFVEFIWISVKKLRPSQPVQESHKDHSRRVKQMKPEIKHDEISQFFLEIFSNVLPCSILCRKKGMNGRCNWREMNFSAGSTSENNTSSNPAQNFSEKK